MVQIKHSQIDSFLKSMTKETLPNIFLVYGEAYLCKNIYNSLTSFILGNAKKEFSLETIDGLSTSMGEVIERVTTFSFLQSKKMVGVKDAPLFYLTDQHSYSKPEIEALLQLVKKGIPEDHSLIMTCRTADKRKALFKAFNAHGTIIDCSVSQGSRKADLDIQKGILRQIVGKILFRTDKILDENAFARIVELTGFNLDTFSQNIDKLISYTEKNQHITVKDVNAIIKRDKKDPIYNLTNALLDKDGKNALFFANSLFTEGFHPLQILKALENQVRKLILVKCFVIRMQTEKGMQRVSGMNFNAFMQLWIPTIVTNDKRFKTHLEEQEILLNPENPDKKIFKFTDLFLAPNPKNAYPVFLIFQKSEKFSLMELINALNFLSDLDFRLKSSALEAETVIEYFIITFCKKGGGDNHEKN
jgi:DNA polymerase III delta subunit